MLSVPALYRGLSAELCSHVVLQVLLIGGSVGLTQITTLKYKFRKSQEVSTYMYSVQKDDKFSMQAKYIM